MLRLQEIDMRIPIENILADFSGHPGATEQFLQAAEKDSGIRLPDDYRNFLIRLNGGEGFIGKHYLILWKAEELHQFNRDYQVSEYAPGFFMFGSTGGGDGFAFDTRSTPYRVMQIPFIGMSVDDAFFVADSFTRLLERMIEVNGPLF
jgi:cell wall assembly regulator SMI1